MIADSKVFYDNIQSKVAEELKQVLNIILNRSEQTIKGLDAIQKASQWYRNAKKDPIYEPPKIFQKIVDECITTLLQEISPALSDHIKIKTAENSIEIKFSLKPYIEYIKKVNGMEQMKVKIAFNIEISGKLSGVRVHSNRVQRLIGIDSLTCSLALSVTKAEVSLMHVSGSLLIEPIVLCTAQPFKIENLLLLSP
jgi:hypothetical protein